MTRSDRRQKTVLHGERLEDAVRELTDFAKERALELRRKHRGQVYRDSPRQSEVEAVLTENLRAALSDEIVPAVSAENSRILQTEFDQEVIKKALVGLHAQTLRSIARANRLETSGSLEDLATRVGRLHLWDRERIARLILDNEPEPTEERAHVERLFVVVRNPDLDAIGERLDYVLGRYIRTGIARWFVFESVETEVDRLVLRGTVRAYRADVTDEADTPSVVAIPRSDHTVSVVIDRSRIVRVRSGNAFESSSAMAALDWIAKVTPLDYVPLSSEGITGGPAVGFAAASLFMLDLLATRFADARLNNRNLTVARFRMEGDTSDDVTSDRPRLKAVRFEGAHLLDSPTACTLIAGEGRALVEIALTVENAPRLDGEISRFPIRVAIERDHVLAMTGYGVMPALSFGIHDDLVKGVSAGLIEGLARPSALMDLAQRIAARARFERPVDHADMLADEASDDSEGAD